MIVAVATLLLFNSAHIDAATGIPGDLDDDFDTTVADIALLVSHLQGTRFLSPDNVTYADLDDNGVLNAMDVEILANLVLDSSGPQVIPAAAIQETLPQRGESNVGVKRETILYFTLPLAEDTVISNDIFFALFGGEKLLTKIEVSSDRTKATLFYLDPLPGNARVRVIFDGTGIKDILGRHFDPDLDGKPGGLYGLDFNTVSITELPGTAISGSVFRSKKNELDQDVPLAGVIIEVVGAEQTIRTTTAGDGSFTLDPCPGGRFFVNIDGRPVTGQFPTGDYYPFVGKAWYAQPGRTDNIVNEDGKIYLPLITAGSLKTVSQTENTVVEFPQAVLDENPSLAGVRVTVPANSLFNEEGVRGGMVGIAPVEPDRIPEPLPEGLNLPLVITVQTDGPANFDRPAPVVFPNLPDPETGEVLPPGSKSALWSFNHDSGEWEIGGPMTVSADGLTIATDPGVGIRQPGWHGTFPWTSLDGGGGVNPDDDRDDDCNDPNGCADDDCQDPDGCDEEEDDCKEEALLAMSGLVQAQANLGLLAPRALPFGIGTSISVSISEAGRQVDNLIAPDRADEFLKGKMQSDALAAPTLLTIPSPDPLSVSWNIALSLPGLWGAYASFGERLGSLAGCLAPLPLSSPTFNSGIRTHAEFRDAESLLESIQSFDPDEYPQLNRYTEYVEIQRQFLKAILELELAFYKEDIWQTAPARPYVTFIFQKLVDDFTIGETEKNAILNSVLRLPEISDSQVTALIDLQNERAANGVSEEDRLVLLDAMLRIKSGLERIRDETPYEDPYFFWNFYLPDLWKELFPPPPDPPIIRSKGSSGDGGGGGGGGGGGPGAYVNSSPVPEVGEHFYKLQNINNGFISRGRTNKLGRVDNLILPADSVFQITYYKPDSNEIALSIFRSPEAGANGRIPVSYFFESNESEPDTDGDGIPDIAEDIAGTDAEDPDSDGDGVLDGAEMTQDTNPLDGSPVSVGLVASIDSGSDLDNLIARNDLLIGSSSGRKEVRIYDTSTSLEPLLIDSFRLDPFDAVDLASSGSLVAVAGGTSGLTILDISDPAAPQELKRITFTSGSVVSVEMNGDFIYTGLEFANGSGGIATIDALTGLTIAETSFSGTPMDLKQNATHLYASAELEVGTDQLISFGKTAGIFPVQTDTVSLPQFAFADDPKYSLFLGIGILYVTTPAGYATYDISAPDTPTLDSNYDFNQLGWKEIVSNGSGLMLAATSVNGTSDDEQNIDLFDVGATGFGNTFLQTLVTPDVSKSVTLYNGIAYAGGTRVNVLNYLPTDTGTTAPTIDIQGPGGGEANEGSIINITASAMDDVQVRNVDFFLDGERIARDGNYPFSASIQAPLLSSGSASLTITAQAFDTAGNSATSAPLEIILTDDMTPPVVISAFPQSGSALLSLNNLGFVASEKLDPNSLDTSNIFLVNAGPDLAFGSGDDFTVLPDSIVPNLETTTVYVNFDTPLEAGQYQLAVTAGIRDLKGNTADDSFTSDFRILAIGEFLDSDGDGLSDELEAMLSIEDPFSGDIIEFDPFNADSDGDGINDGDEDFDNDGIDNRTEFQVYGTKLNDDDSDNDGLKDFDEVDVHGTNPILSDTDGDRLKDGFEINNVGTNPLDIDTDGDLLDDGLENFRGYDPLIPDNGLPHAVSAPVVVYRKSSSSGGNPSSPETSGNTGGEE